jgi:ribosome-associated toxin RatA of RatAB toxin-antitoxin module
MKPITFSCEATLPQAPEEIAALILDVSNWPYFQGWGFLPGIERAEVQTRPEQIVGARIRVTNTDGSRHVEEIVEWRPERRLRLEMKEFSPPLSRLATSFEETWDFERTAGGTHVVRSLRMHAKTALTRPLLWAISIFLKKAIARHLRQIAELQPRG